MASQPTNPFSPPVDPSTTSHILWLLSTCKDYSPVSGRVSFTDQCYHCTAPVISKNNLHACCPFISIVFTLFLPHHHSVFAPRVCGIYKEGGDWRGPRQRTSSSTVSSAFYGSVDPVTEPVIMGWLPGG